ncbi:hypothetical protein ACG7TL_006619 [Trametes sanguinea]
MRHAELSRAKSSLPPRSTGDLSSSDTRSASQAEGERESSTDTSGRYPQSNDSQPPATTGAASTEVEKQDPSVPFTESSASESPPSPLSQTGSMEERRSKRDPLPEDPIQAYLLTRSRGEEALCRFSSDDYIKAIWRSVHTQQADVLLSLVEDAIRITDVRNSKVRGRIVIEVLFQTLSVSRTLRIEHVLSLLRCLKRNNQARFLMTSTRTTLAWWLSKQPMDERDGEALEILMPLLVEKLGALANTDLIKSDWASHSLESTDDGVAVPRILWPLFQLAMRLVLLDRRTQASELLTHLVNRQCIDPDAIAATDLSSLDLLYVVLSVTVRTCMKFGWFTRASALLNMAVPRQEKISRPLGLLIEDWLTRALDRPRAQDLKMIASMFIIIFQRATEDYVLPSNYLLNFYDAAIESEPELAQTVYGYSREAQHHSYPPPRETTLLRMMEHFDSKARNVHLARVLATQVVDENISLPPSIRARFIMHVAVLGFATQARALWEQYSTGEDALYVSAHSKLMLRMISLFVRNANYIRWRLYRRRVMRESEAHGENLEEWPWDDRDDFDDTTSQPTRPSDAEDDYPASDVLSSHSTPSPDAPPSSARKPYDPPMHPGSGPESPSYGFPELSDDQLQEREADFRRFADRVFDAFYQTKLPLEKTDHYTITTIARGAAIVERGTLPMDILLVMKQRKMKMDMRDVNVALSVIAKFDPMKAADYIQRMIDTGLQPDVVSFGTVIHWAARRREGALVQSLVRRASEHGFKTLDYKTLSSLLHTAVRGGLLEDSSPEALLEFAEQTVDSMLEQRVVPTPRVARNALIAALRAEQPEKAYQFWQLYMKGNLNWMDAHHQRVRHILRRKIQRHLKVGWLDSRKAHVMLLDLNDPDVSPYSVPRLGGPNNQRTADAQRKG